MSEKNIWALQDAYGSLCAQGEQFSEPRIITPLDGLTFDHPRRGQVDITVDEETLVAQGRVYTADVSLRDALDRRGIAIYDIDKAVQALGEQASKGAVWGFSGYATRGYGYETEARGLMQLHDYLADIGQEPALVVDGGVSQGSLGLSGVVAKMHGITTMGFIPRQGLASIAPRDHLVIWGDTYKDREILVGTAPDVLVCIGGGEGTQRECQQALRCGSAVLLLALKDYGPASLPATYESLEDTAAAARADSLVVCHSVESIPESVDTILAAQNPNNRANRLNLITNLLENSI